MVSCTVTCDSGWYLTVLWVQDRDSDGETRKGPKEAGSEAEDFEEEEEP